MVWRPRYRQMNRPTYFVEMAPARESIYSVQIGVLIFIKSKRHRVPEDGPLAADGVEAHLQVDEQANILRRDGTSQRIHSVQIREYWFRLESINIYKELKATVSPKMYQRLPMVWRPTYRQMNRPTYFVEMAPAREYRLGCEQRVFIFIKSKRLPCPREWTRGCRWCGGPRTGR